MSTLSFATPTPLSYPDISGKSQNSYTNVLLIDKAVPDYQDFVSSVNSSTFPIVYSVCSQKSDLLALLQQLFTTIPRIGFVFMSNNGGPKTFLDHDLLFLNDETAPYSDNVVFMISLIKQFNVQNIDFLACNTLESSNWTQYYSILQQNTGVIVGASRDKTGNIKYGGDWTMESTGKDIEFVYFTKSIEYYSYLLDSNQNFITAIAGPPKNLLLYNTTLFVADNLVQSFNPITASTINSTFIQQQPTYNSQDLCAIGNTFYVLFINT
ncbi:MAG: DUF4347 domain-containing protein, partial [Chitinophagia bacterium]|nr:DUF4347 domain-containing protein [Chitinophagia bacterium]